MQIREEMNTHVAIAKANSEGGTGVFVMTTRFIVMTRYSTIYE